MVITWLDFGKFLSKTVFWQIYFKNFGCVSSRSNIILAISQEWLVQLMWNEKEVHRLDTGYNMQPWPLTSLMTLTFDVSRSNLKITAWIFGLIDMKWKGIKSIGYWADYDRNHWPHPWPWHWSFKVRDWNSLISRMGPPIDMEWKGCESSIHDHDID